MKRIRCFALFLTMLVACMFMPTNVQAEEATDVAQEVLEARTGVLRINVGAKVTGNTDATLIQVGSGFLIGTEDGDQRVITNYHVVDAANSINEFAKDTNTPVKNIKRVIQVVIASNDVSVDAELEQSSEANDIAILKLKKNIYNSKCFSLSSKANLQETQTVYALGYPYEQTTYGQDFSKLKNEDVTIEKGAVSKFTTKGGTNVIVNSAQISRGNSGGPLVDSQGNVVGVNSYTLGTSDGGNYYYAIEIDTVREMLDAEYILVEGEMAFLKKEYRKALGDFKKAKETAADEEVRQKGASFYAKTCITLTDYQEAIKTLEAKGEYELADWMNLAFAYKCTGNWKKSKELLLQAVLYYPEDYRLYMRLCYLECELQDRKPQALKDYSQLKVYYDKAVSLLNGKTGNEEWIQLKSLIVQLKEYGWM